MVVSLIKKSIMILSILVIMCAIFGIHSVQHASTSFLHLATQLITQGAAYLMHIIKVI